MFYSDPDITEFMRTLNINTPKHESTVFEVGQKYQFVDWFTNDDSVFEVVARCGDFVTLIEHVSDPKGDYDYKRIKKIQTSSNGDEYVVIYEYGCDEARIYAY